MFLPDEAIKKEDNRDKKSAVKALFQLDINTAVFRFLLDVRFPGIRVSA